MAIGNIASADLIDFNVGLSAAVGFLVPLGAQIDALIAAGLGPFQADISARLSALLAAQAGLAISIGNPFLSLQILLSAIATLAAALQGALALGLPNIQIGLQLSAVAALSGSLAITLGGLQIAIKLALAIKIPALRLAADIGASLSAGPLYAFDFNGDTLAAQGAEIAAVFGSTGLTNPPNDPILPGNHCAGICFVVNMDAHASVFGALQAIISV